MKYKTIILIFIMILIGAGCNEYQEWRPMFNIGEVVIVKLDNRNGMIVGYYQKVSFIESRVANYYIVRFANNGSITNTKLLTKDGQISFSPYADAMMRDFELNKVTKNE